MNIIAFISGVLLGIVTVGIPLGYYLKYLWDEEGEEQMTREEAIKLLTQYIDYDAETPDYYTKWKRLAKWLSKH